MQMAAVSPGRQSEIICFFFSFFLYKRNLVLDFQEYFSSRYEGEEKDEHIPTESLFGKRYQRMKSIQISGWQECLIKVWIGVKVPENFVFKLRVTECPQRSKLEIENIEVFVERKSCSGAVWLDWIRSDNKQDEPQPHSCHRFFF